ncbi:ketopantoate reductase family protein [Halovivax gelatinilyticus]|uniref:ketopantoate reductase family protein n=1 Tax=Halovivax gelatinilyticus TaxID=2961597 RepID=UPI0020CA8060|nr:ketopantoate reductase family protein [Halovivax gelatinilyticus]
METVVFGAGSLGSLIGGLLAREHDVTLVGRAAHADRIERDGLAIEGEIDAHVCPSATTDGSDIAAELAVVTVKAFDTQTAAETLATGSFDAVLSLQNGMGNEEILADALACPVLAGTATYGARLERPGLVRCTGLGEVVLGPHDGGTSSLAERIGRAFSVAGIETTVADDMPRRLWEKLAINAAINPVTALVRVENGAVLESPARELALEAARETVRVARAHGVELDESSTLTAVERVASATAKNESSMLQDVRADRRTEVDAISGFVVDRADEVSLDVPTNRTLAGLLRTWERERNLRPSS